MQLSKARADLEGNRDQVRQPRRLILYVPPFNYVVANFAGAADDPTTVTAKWLCPADGRGFPFFPAVAENAEQSYRA